MQRDIESLIGWALIDNGLGDEFVQTDHGFDWRELGTRIDASSRGWSVAPPRLQHDDALQIVRIIREVLEPDDVGLVIHFGRTNCRPDWCEEGVGHSEVKTNRRGQVEWHYERPGDRKSRKLEPKRVWVGETPERVAWYRRQYERWWAALAALVEPMNRVLEKFEATGPKTPARPWEVTVFDAEGRVREGMLGEDASLRRSEHAALGEIELPVSPEGQARQNGILPVSESSRR